MYFSDYLRNKICEKYDVMLQQYVWHDELNDFFMDIKLGIDETLVKTMKEVYELGFNIGNCGLTSRYFAIAMPKAELAYGTLTLLKGTKRSITGNHAWTIIDDYYIDSTLRLMIPKDVASKLGYTVEKVLAYDSARMLSEYQLFSHCVANRNKDIKKFNESLLQIN